MESVSKQKEEPKHMAIVNAIWRAEERVRKLEELYDKILGYPSTKKSEQSVSETEPLASFLENTPKRIDDLINRTDVIIKGLFEVFF